MLKKFCSKDFPLIQLSFFLFLSSCIQPLQKKTESSTKEANVVKTADGGEFVIWSEKIKALQWDFNGTPHEAICFLTSYLSKKQVEAWKKTDDDLLKGYSKLRTEIRTQNLRNFLSELNHFKNPFASQDSDKLWPWITRESEKELADFGTLIRHFGNFTSPIKDEALNRPVSEKGFNQFLLQKMSESSSALATLNQTPLPEPQEGLTDAEYKKRVKNADNGAGFLGMGVMTTLLIISGGGSIGGILAPMFLLAPVVMLVAGPVTAGLSANKTLRAQKAVIAAERNAEVKKLERELAPKQALFDALKETKHVVLENEIPEVKNITEKLNSEIEKLVAEYIASGSNEEQVWQEFYSSQRDFSDPATHEESQRAFEKTTYYKNTKCPQNAKGTSLDEYWMSPINWM